MLALHSEDNFGKTIDYRLFFGELEKLWFQVRGEMMCLVILSDFQVPCEHRSKPLADIPLNPG